MCTKICYGLALVIVISIIFLFLGRLGNETPSTKQFPNGPPTSPPPVPAFVPPAPASRSATAPASRSATETALPASQSGTVARPEMTFLLQQYPEDPDPWNRGYAIRVRLDVDRLRAHDLTKEDMLQAMAEGCGVVGSPGRQRPDPPPGVVYFPRVNPDRVENLILKASSDGTIVRLKDIAEVDGGWSIFDIAHWLFGI